MKKRTMFAFAAALAGLLSPGAASAQMKVGVIVSATGPVSVVGIPQKNTVALLPKKIGGVDVEYEVLDDASDPTQSVQHAKKLLSDGVDAIVGPSGSPNAVGILGFVAEAKTPLLAPVGTAAVILPMDDKKKWVFKTTQNDDLIAAAILDHMKAHGVKTLGIIASSDPFGENWIKTVRGLAAKVGIAIVAEERYQRVDTSVTGQSLKIVGARSRRGSDRLGRRRDGAAGGDAGRPGLCGQDLPDPWRGFAQFPEARWRKGRGNPARGQRHAGARPDR